MISLRVLFHLWVIFLSEIAAAQRTVALSGKVVDKANCEPLNSASITLKGRSSSTIANAEGAFTFYIPALCKNDTLRKSVTRYEFFDSPRTPIDILVLAMKEISANYSSTPFVQNPFCRVQHAEGRYASLIEAALQAHNLNLSEP